MSINHLVNSNQEPRYDIYVNNIDCKKVTVEEPFDQLQFKCQNGDVVNLSSLPDHGIGNYRLTSDGDGTLSWTEGAGSAGIDYSGNVPVAIGKLAIYGATNGKLIKDSTLSDTDLLNKDGSVPMTGNLDLQNNSLLNAGNISINNSTISSSSVLEFKSGASDRVNFKSDNGILSIENNNLGGNVELEFSQFGFDTFTILKDSSKVDLCQSGNNNIEITTDCFALNKKVIFNPTTSTTQFRDYDVDMNNNDIENVSIVDTGVINTNTITSTNPDIDVIANLNMNNGNILNANDVYITELLATAPATDIQVRNNLRMRGNDIVDTDNIEVNFGITTADIKTDTITTNTTGKILFNDNVDLFNNDILSSGDIKTTS
jgi:hypothetical protein